MKDELLKARVSRDLKAKIAALAKDRGESEAVIIREALNTYVVREESSTLAENHTVPPPPRARPVRYTEKPHPKRKAG